MARALAPARRDLHPGGLRRPGWPRRPCPTAPARFRTARAVAAPEARALHRAPRHASLPRTPDRLAARPAAAHRAIIHGGMGREERRKAQESFLHDPEVQRAARHRRRGRRHQPAARPPDGELRPAVEPEPPGAALRPHPPHRPDRGLPPVEPRGRGDARGRRLPPAAREARGSAAASAARCSTCSASSSSRTSRCATSSSKRSATATGPRCAHGSRGRSSTGSIGRTCKDLH